jgi:hypothetical protein
LLVCLYDERRGFGAYEHSGCVHRSCIIGGLVSSNVRENRFAVYNTESTSGSTSFFFRDWSPKGRTNGVGSRIGRLGSDTGGDDRLELLIMDED